MSFAKVVFKMLKNYARIRGKHVGLTFHVGKTKMQPVFMKTALSRVDDADLVSSPATPSDLPAASDPEVVFVKPVEPNYDDGFILLVDDEPAILTVMKIALVKSGFHVVVASNGAEALEKFEQKRDAIRILITDMAMPGMNGLDLIRYIRNFNTPLEIVATTGMTTLDQMQAIRDAGVRHVLSKPCSSRQLIEMARNLFSKP